MEHRFSNENFISESDSLSPDRLRTALLEDLEGIVPSHRVLLSLKEAFISTGGDEDGEDFDLDYTLYISFPNVSGVYGNDFQNTSKLIGEVCGYTVDRREVQVEWELRLDEFLSLSKFIEVH